MNITSSNHLFLFLFAIFFAFTVQSCASGESEEAETVTEEPRRSEFDDLNLTPFQEEHGLGPITERITISEEIDEELSIRGQSIFEMKCQICHGMDQRKIGPSLGDVVERRSPEFIMNFIVNPGENVRNHPVGLDLLAEHHTEMPYQNVNLDEARAIYEYLRDYYNQ
ncbi:MAG: cytochrome c [Balneolaceae bacterium]|nr:MAG: cytochrome c [Balneolaceae bacterium]